VKTLLQSSKEYLACHRTLGYKMAHHGHYLQDFVAFMSRKKAKYITSKLALEWAMRPKGITLHTKAVRLGTIRRFAQHRALTDQRTEVPSSKLLSTKYRRRHPHIYSQDEIKKLLIVAISPPKPYWGIESYTLYTMIGLAASTGLRRCELLNLNQEDVDLCRGILKIDKTKFQKTRMVPLHPSVTKKLRRYCRLRARQPNLITNAFFVTKRGTRVPVPTLNFAFRHASVFAGLRAPTDSHGIRLHDLRHTFAVNALIRLLRSYSDDIDCKIPAISTYLGHINPIATYWYFSCVPELMKLARARLERAARCGI
jgi:integrase/recombinase XerD